MGAFLERDYGVEVLARYFAVMTVGDCESSPSRMVMARGTSVGVGPYSVEVPDPEDNLIVGSSGDGYLGEAERYSEAAVD